MQNLSRTMAAGSLGLLAGLLLAPRWDGTTAAQEPIAKGGKHPAFHLVLVSAGNGSEALRYRPDSGETWIAKNATWQKVADADSLPPGDYEVQMVGLPTVNAVEVTRLERSSGRGWVMRNFKWLEITEAK